MKKLNMLSFMIIALFCITLVSAQWTQGLNSEIRSFWKLNETGTGVRVDSVGFKNGTLSGGAMNTTSGKISNGAVGDGTNRINFTNAMTSTDTIAISAWIQKSGAAGSYNFRWFGDTTTNQIGVNYNDCAQTSVDGISVVTNSECTNVVNGSMAGSGYRHIVLMAGADIGNRQLVYIDGVLITNKSASAFTNFSNNFLMLTTAPNSMFVDEVGVWTRALTNSEVTTLYNGGTGITFTQNLPPIVTLDTPANNSFILANSIYFNASLDANSISTLINATLNIWFANGTLFSRTNMSVTGASNVSAFNITNVNFVESYLWNIHACNAVGCSFGSSNRSFTYGYQTNQEIWNNNSVVSNVESFYLNITTASGNSLTSASLFYKNTTYSIPISNFGSNYVMNGSLTIDSSFAGTNNLYWSLLFSNGIILNTTTRTQTVSVLSAPIVSTGSCGSAGYSPVYNFTIKDEKNFSILPAQIEYNFKYGTVNGTTSSLFGSFASTPSFQLCFNFTQSATWTIGEGQVHYKVYPNGTYVERNYYVFDDTSITNRTENVTLYDLETSEQTSFKLEVLDGSSLLPFENRYTALLRWYPNLNEYRIVEMGKTDETGSTVIHVETEDVDYRVAVYERNGSLLKLASPTRMICLVNPCTYSIKINDDDQDLTSFLNIQYTFTYNYTTGIWLFTYTDASQRTDLMNMSIYRITGTSTAIICSSSSTAFTGVLSCNTSLYTGTLKGVVERVASPPIPIASKIINAVNTAFKSAYGLWILLLIALPIVLIFAFYSPVAAVIGGVISLIPGLYLGSINVAIIGAIAILGGIVIHFMKRI